MPRSDGLLPANARDRRIWWISIGSATLAFLCSFIALCLLSKRPAEFPDALYSSAQVLLLAMPDDFLKRASGNTPALFLIYSARLLAVVWFASAGVALVAGTLGRRIRLVRTARNGNHAVICGLGPVGSELANQMIAGKHKVVVIDRGQDEAAVNGVLESGASVIVGDPADPRFLRRAGAASAKFLFAASSNDTANISAGLQATGLVHVSPRAAARKAVGVYVHVADPQLRAELHKRRLLADSAVHLHAGTFSVFDNSARLLLQEHPLDHARMDADDPRYVQLILVGFGILGEAILIRAALAGHYGNLKRLRAVVVDSGAARAERIFRSRYPQFDKVADAAFLDLDPEEPETQSHIAALCAKMIESISTVVVPLEHPTGALTLALSLAGRLHNSVPVRFRLDEDAALGELIGRRPMTPFGNIAKACRAENWADRDLDVMARALHEEFTRNNPVNPSSVAWDWLSEDLRESNRQAADHIPVKLPAVGCHAMRAGSRDPGALVAEFTTEEVEVLARMEHRRWMAERFLAGWVPGPKDLDKRTSPYLVEWEDLPTHPVNIPDNDRNAVRILPEVLGRVGMEIRRGAAGLSTS